jgi:hypothetical protein
MAQQCWGAAGKQANIQTNPFYPLIIGRKYNTATHHDYNESALGSYSFEVPSSAMHARPSRRLPLSLDASTL